jgi:predicted metal-dependent peptidase
MSETLPQPIAQARIRLMLQEPYLASAIARFPIINAADSDWCQTMATDGYYIYVNPEFCATLSLDETAFVFAHEVMHCVLGHIDRRGTRDPQNWNYAIDYATNLMLVELGLKMPKVGLLDRDYRGMTAEDIYDRLKKKASEKKSGSSNPKVGTFGEGGSAECGGWDLHLPSGDLRGQAIRAKEFPSAEERKRLRISLTKGMESSLRGVAPGLFDSEIKQARGGDVPWRALVARFFTGLRQDDYRMFPPNKKHIWRGIYLPSIGAPGPSHIAVAVDTSGSMSDEVLGEILGEIDKLRSVTNCRLTLIQCDAKVQKVDDFESTDETQFDRYQFHGRGGTAFEPVFDWIAEQSTKSYFQLDALIYLTDGFGSFPQKPPSYPLLWIMTDKSQPNVPFGTVIRLHAQTD